MDKEVAVEIWAQRDAQNAAYEAYEQYLKVWRMRLQDAVEGSAERDRISYVQVRTRVEMEEAVEELQQYQTDFTDDVSWLEEGRAEVYGTDDKGCRWRVTLTLPLVPDDYDEWI